jgi:hypothetical protein
MTVSKRILPIVAAIPLLSGCVVGTVAKTAVDVVTLPVKVASAGVDAATTSQSEADEKRGREMRKQDEERGKQPAPWPSAAARDARFRRTSAPSIHS